MEVKDTSFNKKVKKIGVKTLGIVLIIFGIIFLIQVLFKIDILRYILLAWPIVLIFLGMEILIESKKNEIKISIASFIIISFLIGFSFLLGAVNVIINNVLYSDEFINEAFNTSRVHYLNEKENISVFNYSNQLVNLKVIENSSCESKILVNVKYDFENSNNIANLVNNLNNNTYPILTLKNKIEVIDSLAKVKNIDITVITSDKNKLETYGNIDIKYE